MKNSMTRMMACLMSLTLCAAGASYAAETEKAAPQAASDAGGIRSRNAAEPLSRPPVVVSPEDKAAWRRRVVSSEIGAGVLYGAGAAGTIAGIAFIVNGNQQRNNAQFKQKGNILTNEDDVNAGNDKVLKGDISLVAGALGIVGGLLMTRHISQLNEEGRSKGFTTSYIPTEKGGTLSVAYFCRF